MNEERTRQWLRQVEQNIMCAIATQKKNAFITYLKYITTNTWEEDLLCVLTYIQIKIKIAEFQNGMTSS